MFFCLRAIKTEFCWQKSRLFSKSVVVFEKRCSYVSRTYRFFFKCLQIIELISFFLNFFYLRSGPPATKKSEWISKLCFLEHLAMWRRHAKKSKSADFAGCWNSFWPKLDCSFFSPGSQLTALFFGGPFNIFSSFLRILGSAESCRKFW